MKLTFILFLLLVVNACSSIPPLSSQQKEALENNGNSYSDISFCNDYSHKPTGKDLAKKLYPEWDQSRRFEYGITKKFALDPIYADVVMVGGEELCAPIFTRKYSEKYYYLHDVDTNERTQTDITRFFFHDKYGFNDDTNTLYVIEYGNPLGIKLVVENAKTHRNHNNLEIPYLYENDGAYLTKTQLDGEIYYQYINNKGEKTFKVNEKDVISRHYLPLVELENGLFYPILFDGNGVKYEPEANEFFQGVELTEDRKKFMHPVYKDKNGATLHSFKFPKLKDSTIEEHLKKYESIAQESGFYLIEDNLDGAEVTLGNAIPMKLKLVKLIKTQKYEFYHYNTFLGSYARIVMLLDGVRGQWADHQVEFETEELSREGFRKTMLMAEKADNYQKAKIKYDAEMAKPNEWAQRNAAERRRKEAALAERVKQSEQNNANRAKFSDIDLTGGVDVSEETVINNAKCRDQANRMNRQTGKTTYGCK